MNDAEQLQKAENIVERINKYVTKMKKKYEIDELFWSLTNLEDDEGKPVDNKNVCKLITRTKDLLNARYINSTNFNSIEEQVTAMKRGIRLAADKQHRVDLGDPMEKIIEAQKKIEEIEKKDA